jgi:GxxExxY protein
MKLLFEDQTYKIIGCCFEVHKTLGKGFKEIVYKDALSVEFMNHNIPFEREKQFKINYKGTILPHHYCTDFILFNSVLWK